MSRREVIACRVVEAVARSAATITLPAFQKQVELYIHELQRPDVLEDWHMSLVPGEVQRLTQYGVASGFISNSLRLKINRAFRSVGGISSLEGGAAQNERGMLLNVLRMILDDVKKLPPAPVSFPEGEILEALKRTTSLRKLAADLEDVFQRHDLTLSAFVEGQDVFVANDDYEFSVLARPYNEVLRELKKMAGAH